MIKESIFQHLFEVFHKLLHCDPGIIIPVDSISIEAHELLVEFLAFAVLQEDEELLVSSEVLILALEVLHHDAVSLEDERARVVAHLPDTVLLTGLLKKVRRVDSLLHYLLRLQRVREVNAQRDIQVLDGIGKVPVQISFIK